LQFWSLTDNFLDPKFQNFKSNNDAFKPSKQSTFSGSHFTEKSFHRNFLTEGHLTETPFDRTPFDQMPFDRKFIRPNHRLTERRLIEISFYRMADFFQKMVIWPNLLSTKKFIWPKKITHKVVWPKAFSDNDHLTERSFDRKIIWPKGHLTYFFFKLSFSKNCQQSCSYSIWIVHVPNFFVAARRRERKELFLYCNYYYSNRVENIIKVTDCNE
jgi:hypothetical protein